jgi:hypothetical protein
VLVRAYPISIASTPFYTGEQCQKIAHKSRRNNDLLSHRPSRDGPARAPAIALTSGACEPLSYSGRAKFSEARNRRYRQFAHAHGRVRTAYSSVLFILGRRLILSQRRQ